jgi:hypothetical protein
MTGAVSEGRWSVLAGNDAIIDSEGTIMLKNTQFSRGQKGFSGNGGKEEAAGKSNLWLFEVKKLKNILKKIYFCAYFCSEKKNRKGPVVKMIVACVFCVNFPRSISRNSGELLIELFLNEQTSTSPRILTHTHLHANALPTRRQRYNRGHNVCVLHFGHYPRVMNQKCDSSTKEMTSHAH